MTPTHHTPSSQAVRAPEDVLVIGAGPAGIACAYFLQRAGLRYRVIDRANVIAATWARLYPSLKLNTSRFFSHMPGMRFPLRYGIFPTGRQYYDYLLKFVERHNFNIHLEIEVYRVAPEGDLWRVETSEGTFLYPVVITATGIYENPIVPRIPGMETFQGRVFHAHDFKDPRQVTGERVLVVGNGPSGVDIAVASGDTAAAVDIAIRSGIVLRRRYPLGLPRHAWLMLAEHLPRRWCRWLMKKLGGIGYRDVERYGLKPPPPGQGGLTAYQGPELLEAVRAGRVHPVPGPVRFTTGGVQFADGSERPYDTVVLCTGYEPVLHRYLDIEMQYSDEPYQPPSPCDWRIGPNGQRGWPLRDTSEHPNGRQILGYPGLYLVGTFYKGKGATYNMNVEAAIATQQIQEYLARHRRQQAEPAGHPPQAVPQTG